MDESIEATATVLVDVALASDPTGWEPGPLELRYLDPSGRKIVTHAAARSSYFHKRAAATLYGDSEHTARWHRIPPVGTSLAGRPVTAVELIRIPTFVAPSRGYLIVHVDLGTDPLGALGRLRWPPADIVRALTEGSAAPAPGATRAVTVAYVRFEDGLPPGPFGEGYEAWDDAEQWLRTLASATSPAELEPDPLLDRQPMVALSRSWRAMPLRNGVAFLALRATAGDPFLSSAQPAIYVRTIYTDAVLLGLMQKLTLHDIAERLSERTAPDPLARLREIEVQLDTFRTTLWWQNVTEHGLANDLLVAFQQQHGLVKLLEQVISDLSDSSRLHGLIDSERTANSLNAIAAIGLPAGAVLAATPIWVDYGIGVAATAILLATALAVTSVLVLRHMAKSRTK